MNDIQNATPEEDIANQILYGLWEEWIAEAISIGTEPPKETAAIANFAKITGCTIHSPLAMLFRGFRAGVVKGMELQTRTDAKA